MKRIAFLLLATTLGGCVVVTPTPQPPALEVLSATYATNYRVEDGTEDGTSVICDNRVTTLEYRFTYQGELESWTSYLQGRELKRIEGRESFTPGSRNVSPYEESGYVVTYTINPHQAPYQNGVAGELSPQAIDVVPVPDPDIIGATTLYLTLKGADGDSQPYRSQDIPVIDICP